MRQQLGSPSAPKRQIADAPWRPNDDGAGLATAEACPRWLALYRELVVAVKRPTPGHLVNSHKFVTPMIMHCRRSLANYKIPRRVEFSDVEVPKTESGRILKADCA